MRSSCCLVSALLLALVLARNAQNVDFSFNYNFTGPKLLLDGNCTVDNSGLLRLSVNSSDPNLGSGRDLASRAVYAQPVQLYDPATGAAASFNTSFVVGRKTVPGIPTGDGMTFLIAPTRSVPRNSKGGNLGLYDTNAYSPGNPQIQVVAVEWDTHNGTTDDIDNNHVGLDINSVISVAWQELDKLGFQLNDSLQTFRAWIKYDAAAEQMLVYMANWELSSKSGAALVLSYTGFNLSRYVQSRSYVGFTATTGFYIQENYIYDWSFSSRGLPTAPAPVPEADPFPGGKGSGPGGNASRDEAGTGSSNVGLIAGAVSGGVAFLVVLGVVAGCCCLFCRTEGHERSSEEPAQLLAPGGGWNGPGRGSPIPSGGSSSSQKKSSSTSASSGSSWDDLYSPNVTYGPRPYSYQELKDAARGFSTTEMLVRNTFCPTA